MGSLTLTQRVVRVKMTSSRQRILGQNIQYLMLERHQDGRQFLAHVSQRAGGGHTHVEHIVSALMHKRCGQGHHLVLPSGHTKPIERHILHSVFDGPLQRTPLRPTRLAPTLQP